MERPDSNETRNRLVEVIGNCVFHALGLVDTLTEERRALEGQDMDALDTAIIAKSKCVEELRLVEEERKKLCVAAGFPAGPQQMNELIEWCDEYAIVANCWHQLLDLVTQCDLLNMTNGAIIRGRKQQVDTSISIIRGGQPGTPIYNRDGREPQRAHLRSIAEA